MKRVLIGTIVGAVVLFMWNFVSWTVLPWHNMTIHDMPAGTKLSADFKAGSLPTGVYWYPEMQREVEAASEAEKVKGSFGMVIHQAEPVELMPPSIFPKAFALNLLCALIVSMILRKVASGSCGCYGGRLTAVLLMGLIPGAVRDVPMMLWMHVPMEYTFVNAADSVVGFFLMGLALAAIVKPATKSAEPPQTAST